MEADRVERISSMPAGRTELPGRLRGRGRVRSGRTAPRRMRERSREMEAGRAEASKMEALKMEALRTPEAGRTEMPASITDIQAHGRAAPANIQAIQAHGRGMPHRIRRRERARRTATALTAAGMPMAVRMPGSPVREIISTAPETAATEPIPEECRRRKGKRRKSSERLGIRFGKRRSQCW